MATKTALCTPRENVCLLHLDGHFRPAGGKTQLALARLQRKRIGPGALLDDPVRFTGRIYIVSGRIQPLELRNELKWY